MDIEKNYSKRNGCFYLLENEEGKSIATVNLYKIDEAKVELRKRYLLKSERGKGLGKLLMNHAIDQSK